jgi:hypothetical protein
VTRVTDGLILAGGEAPITGAVIQMLHIFVLFCYKHCCGSGKFIPDPGFAFYPSRIPDTAFDPFRIPDPTTATKKERKQATNIPKLKIILFLNR